MKKKLLSCLTATLMIVGVIWISISENQADPNLTLAQKIEQQIKSSSHIVELRLDPASQPDEYARIQSKDETPIHTNGIYGLEQADFIVFKQNPLDFLLVSRPYTRIIDPTGDVYSQQECEAIAVKTLEVLFRKFLEQGPLPDPLVSGPGRNGIYSFVWQRYKDDGFPDSRAHIAVRSLDGKVIGFGSSKFVGEWQHKITPTQAKANALEYGRSKSEVKEVVVRQLNVDGAGGKRFYNISLEATNAETGTRLHIGVRVDAETGDVSSDPQEWSVDRASMQIPSRLPQDREPVWTKQGLIFVSQRSLAGLPSWALSPEQLFIQSTNDQLLSITSDLASGELSSVGSSVVNDWVVFRWRGWEYALNLAEGSYRVLADPNRDSTTPAIQPDGKWTVSVGVAATGNAGSDLMPDTLLRTPEMALRGRLLIPKSDEQLPVFSPDGTWLYFLKLEEKKEGFVTSLQRIPATLARTKERLLITGEQQQTIVEKLPFLIERLSITPNGKNLIAQVPVDYVPKQEAPGKPFKNVKVPARIVVIDVTSKQVSELKLPTLKDAEVKATIQDINDAWAGPGNDEVTFSGKTIDADKKERRRIYSCRFDGSDLKALTPAENKPVPAYKFPEGDKTAYQLAKEMALGEIAWDEKHRDQ